MELEAAQADLDTFTDPEHAPHRYQIAVEEPHPDGRMVPRRAGMDVYLRTVAAALERKREAETRLARLRADHARKREVQGASVTRLVQANKGIKAVVDMCRDALIHTEGWYEADGAFPGLQAREAELDAIEDQAERLGQGNLRTALEGTANLIRADVREIRGGIDSRRREQIKAQVEAAVAGDEPARLEIEGLMRRVPLAFWPSAADELQMCQFARSTDATSLHLFLEGVGP